MAADRDGNEVAGSRCTVKRAHVAVSAGYMRKEEAAHYLGVSVRTLSDWMKKRIVPYIKLSHRVCLFRRSDLDVALNQFRTAAIGE